MFTNCKVFEFTKDEFFYQPLTKYNDPNLFRNIPSSSYKATFNLLMIPIRREYVYISFDVSHDTLDINYRTLEGSVSWYVVVKQNNTNKQ